MKKRGSRFEVFNGKALRTSGGLTKGDLIKNSKGQIVSRKASRVAKLKNNLGGYRQTKNRRSTRRKAKPNAEKNFDKIWRDPPKVKRKRKKKS